MITLDGVDNEAFGQTKVQITLRYVLHALIICCLDISIMVRVRIMGKVNHNISHNIFSLGVLT